MKACGVLRALAASRSRRRFRSSGSFKLVAAMLGTISIDGSQIVLPAGLTGKKSPPITAPGPFFQETVCGDAPALIDYVKPSRYRQAAAWLLILFRIAERCGWPRRDPLAAFRAAPD